MSAQGRYVCPDCRRSYQAQETLNRHRKNHSRHAEYVCNVCHVGFHRNDLLIRHMRLHQDNEGSAGTPKGRQRSRRACHRCSRLKIKCDSQRPCSSCQRGQFTCSYDQQSTARARGLSVDAAGGSGSTQSSSSSPPQSLMPGSDDLGASAVTNGVSQVSLTGQLMDPAGHPLGQSSKVLPDRTLEDPRALDMAGQPPLDEGIPPGLEQFNLFDGGWNWGSTDVTMSDNVTWPWLHETMFLQDDPMPNIQFPGITTEYYSPSTTGSSGYQEANHLHDPAMQAAHDQDMSDRAAFQYNEFGLPGDTKFAGVNIPASTPSSTQERKTPREKMGPVAFDSAQHEVQRETIDNMVDVAINLSHPLPDRATASQFWQETSSRVVEAFGLSRFQYAEKSTTHILHHFVGLYFVHFATLWPLIWKDNLNYDSIPSYLYVTLAAIGAIYAGEVCSTFGFQAHESIRMRLLAIQFQFTYPEEIYEPLLQSMLLIQVSALYFGQKQAFSVAQQLGGVLVAVARKINLFGDSSFLPRGAEPPFRGEELLSRWVRAETRKRLALGIFRTEVFVSHLLNTRPLVSYEEVNIELPCANMIWNLKTKDLHRHILDFELYAERKEALFSDLVRIALDRSETLPNLKAADFEALLFGLQQLVWSFSHDPEMMLRLTGEMEPDTVQHLQDDLFGTWSFAAKSVETPTDGPDRADSLIRVSTKDHLDCSQRQMNDLKNDYHRTFAALRKWKRSFAASSVAVQGQAERLTVLATRLLYHLSFVRLKADVQTFHLLALQLVKGRPRQHSVSSVYRWSTTLEARIALDHACAIWLLVRRETERDSATRARFNILSHISLHHAASVVWAYAGTHDSPGEAALDMADQYGDVQRGDLRIFRANNHALMQSFSGLLRKVAPAWIKQSSFSTTASAMAQYPFPLAPSPLTSPVAAPATAAVVV